ncbi:MAG: epoxyqueuosine reductase [Planctomycetota bacterium]|jgi:epoxyqueuosine reductase
MGQQAEIMELAREIGFDLVGIAPLRPPKGAQLFEDWLQAGHQADMGWFESQKERILDPRRILKEGMSLLVLGLSHARPAIHLGAGGRIARYAAGRDYHNVIGRMLKKLAKQLREKGLLSASRAIVDAGPLMERSHAAEAGLGFESKSANLLHRHIGPWFFLGELILDLDLEPTETPALGSCGTCTACIDACPTQAIREPGVVDARLCISYHTIENRGEIPRELRSKLGGWLFGCDVCSEVCPFGQKATGGEARFGSHAGVEGKTLIEWLLSSKEQLAEPLLGSPLQRAKRDGLARNAALALAMQPSERSRESLLKALEDDPSAMVREAAGWALGQAHAADEGTQAALERACGRAETESERVGLSASLETLGER